MLNLTGAQVTHALRVAPDKSYCYLQNPKAACSTVKYALLEKAHKYGDLKEMPPPGDGTSD